MAQKPALGLISAIAVVIGCMIGTGIFIKPATMAAHAGSVTMVMLAWLTGGLLSYGGALTYGELCARMPAAGGEYALLRASYGNAAAFFYGWMRFTIGAPGSAASYAVGAAVFLHVVIPYEALGIRVWHMAVIFIAIFTTLNSIAIFVSASVQVALTFLKLASMVAIIGVLFFLTPATAVASPPSGWPGTASFAAALMAALWAYDGWNNLPMLGGELKNARRNLPLALAIGIAIVLAMYLVINLAYFHTLSFDEVVAANASLGANRPPVASVALAKYFSTGAVKIIAAIFVVSALGAMNGSIFASARVPYAMARDGLFFAPLARLSERHNIPIISTVVQGVVAAILAMSGTFDQLTDSVVFASWIFYALTAGAIFKVRASSSEPSGGSIFRVPFYPVLPLLFLVCAAAFIVYAVVAMPKLTSLGAAIILAGLPFYWFFSKKLPIRQ